MQKELRSSLRCMVQCKECKLSHRVSYYLTRCKATGKRVSRSKHIYCDVFVPTAKAKAEAKANGIVLTKTGAWLKGKAPTGVTTE